MVARVPEAVAVAVMRKADLIPLTPYPGSKVKWKCLCLQCGEVAHPIYNSVQQGVGGCWECGIAKSANSRRTSPEIAQHQLRAAGAEPNAKFPGIMVPWPSICRVCGEHISPNLHNIRNGQGACKFCARRCVNPLVAAGKMLAAGARPRTAYSGSNEPWPSSPASHPANIVRETRLTWVMPKRLCLKPVYFPACLGLGRTFLGAANA